MGKKDVRKNSSKKKFFDDQKLWGILAVGIGLFLVFGFALNFSNMTGQATSKGIVEDLKPLGEGIIKILEPLAKTLLGDVSGELLFAKVLFFLIVFGIIYLALGQVPFFSEKRGISFLIVVSASILAVRWIGGSEIIKTIILPYSAIGIAVSAGLPFVIYFLVINKGLIGQPTLVRQTAWVFFAIVFIGLWFSRSPELGKFHYIYLLAAVVAGIIAWMDGTIKKYFLKIEGGKAKIEINRKALSRFKMELAELTKEFQDTGLTPSAFKARQKVILDKMLALSED